MIPRRLMQTWNTETIPETWHAGPASFKALHPDWQYTLFTHQDRIDFIATHFPSLLKIFVSFPYVIQQADMIRYAYLYIYGGVYADLKTVFHQSLDQFFNITKGDLFIIRNAQISERASNYFLASTPRHPFWLACLYDILQNAGTVPWYIWGKHCTVFYSCGPWLLERVLALPPYNQLRSSILLPAKFHQCRASNGNGSYISSLKGQSWNSWDSHFINYGYKHRKLIMTALLLYLIWLVLNKRNAVERR